MSGISINIQSDELNAAIAEIDKLGDAMKSADLLRIVGRSMQQTIKEHFEALSRDSIHHQSADSLGAPRTGFYEKASDAVQSPQTEDEGVSVSILMQGLAQRYFGGTISAQPGHFLTIPARAEAYGHRAREFQNLRLIMFPSGLAALEDKDEPSHEGSVYYWLVRSVHQDPDPTVLPSEDEILDPALSAARDYIDRAFERKPA